jgi:phospholipid-binding lipoprotein MlaA
MGMLMTNSFSFSRQLLAGCGLALALLSGCATMPNPRDPVEGINRVVFALNDGLDALAIKPVARIYDATLPQPIKQGVSNFFGNIEDIFTGVNNMLQGKMSDGARDLGRVMVNSSVGLLGVIDVATDLGLEKHDEDFGQTFGRWGVGSGPYVVLPVFGPRTARDTVGLVLDSKVDPVGQVEDVGVRNSLTGLRLVNRRAQLLPADKVIEEAALDRYAYVRDAYLQRRLNLVHDGNPPRRDFDED